MITPIPVDPKIEIKQKLSKETMQTIKEMQR